LAKNELPWFKFWVNDWASDADISTVWSARQVGWYMRLLPFCWQECGLPNAMHALRRVAGVSYDYELIEELAATQDSNHEHTQLVTDEFQQVIDKFSLDIDGRLWHPKLYKEFIESLQTHESNVEKGRKGGRPRKVQVLPQQTSAKPEVLSDETSAKPEGVIRARLNSVFCSSESIKALTEIQTSAEKEKKPEPNYESLEFTENEPGFWSERWYSRHPKAKDLPLVQRWCVEAWQRFGSAALETFRVIDRSHEAWCETDDWRKQNGRYCPKLADWLTDRGWKKVPVGVEEDDGYVEVNPWAKPK
jgi:hypothetical protein